jgi:hypothetical protein
MVGMVAGSIPAGGSSVISQEIGDSPNPRPWVRAGSCSGGALGCCGGLVVVGGVGDQLAEELPGGGVDHADVEVVDNQDDMGSGVGSADAEVVQPAGYAQGDPAAVVDAVVADPVVGSASRLLAGWALGRCHRRSRGGPVRQGPVRLAVVVLVGEGVERGLQLRDGGGWTGWAASHFLEGLVEAFDLAIGLGLSG